MEYSRSCRLRASVEPDHLDQLVDPLAAYVRRHVEQPAVEVERFLGVEEPVEIRLFRQVADPLVLGDVGGRLAEDQRLALGRKEQPQQQLDRRRLARAVRAQQAEDLAAADFQVERLEGPDLLPAPEIAVHLGQGPRLENNFFAHKRDRGSANRRRKTAWSGAGDGAAWRHARHASENPT